MKIKGTIQGETEIVLIDCGATHSFIDQQLAEQLKLSIISQKNFKVTLEDGQSVKRF